MFSQAFFAVGLQRQRVLQPTLGGGGRQAGLLVDGAGVFVLQRAALLLRGVDGARQLGAACGEAALGKLRFLGLALQAALLLAAGAQAALGVYHRITQLGFTLLAVGQLGIEFFKARLGLGAALLQFVELGMDFRQVGIDLLAALLRLLGLLRQAQGVHLQLVRLRLCLAGLAAGTLQALGGILVLGLGTRQRAACRVTKQLLGAQCFVKLLDLLRARQQTGLLGVLRVKIHAVRAHAVAVGQVQRLARHQLAAQGPGVVE